MQAADAILEEVERLPPAEQLRLYRRLGAKLPPEAVGETVRPALIGQVDGFWIGAGEPLPTSRPAYRATGALLPQAGLTLAESPEVLDLVMIDGAWFPLSEGGLYSYVHSSALVHGQPYRFAVAGGEWGAEIYEVTLGRSIKLTTVRRRFGPEAAARARNDRSTVQLKLQRIG